MQVFLLVCINGKGMKLSFAAPYMPPDAWIRKIGPLYPELTFVLTSTIDSSYSIYNRYEVSGGSLKYSQSYMGYTLLRAGTAYLIERSMDRFETPQERKAWVMKWLLFPLMPWSSKIVKFDDEENDPIYYEVGGKD